MTTLPLTGELLREYNNVATTPPTAPLGDLLNQIASAAAAVVWQPGGVSSGIVVATWEEVEAFFEAQNPKVPTYLWVDNSITTPVIPATADTDFDGRVTWAPFRFAAGSPVSVEVADGGIIRNPGTFNSNMIIHGAPSVQPFILLDRLGSAVLFRENATLLLDAGATAPAVDVLDQLCETAFFEAGFAMSNAGPLVPMVRLPGSTFFITAGLVNATGQGSCFPANFIQGDGTNLVIEVFDSGSRPAVQTLYAGTVFPIYIDRAQDAIPSAGNTASRPLIPSQSQPQLGQMYFDTDLGLPIWWNGAAWVDATGAPV